MNKKMVKIISIMLLAIMMVALASTTCFALQPNDIKPVDTPAVSSISSFGGKLAGVLQAVGVVVSVVILIVLGIKYMLGSAEEKAEYKKTFIPYIVGAALIFASTTIANIVINFIASK